MAASRGTGDGWGTFKGPAEAYAYCSVCVLLTENASKARRCCGSCCAKL